MVTIGKCLRSSSVANTVRAADSNAALPTAVDAMTTSPRLDADRSVLYRGLVLAPLNAATHTGSWMDPAKYEFQREFAKRYLAEGEAKVLLKQLALKFGPLSEAVTARVKGASLAELDAWTSRVSHRDNPRRVLVLSGGIHHVAPSSRALSSGRPGRGEAAVLVMWLGHGRS